MREVRGSGDANGPEEYAGEWDAGAMGCGELIVKLRLRMQAVGPGQLFRLVALDPGAREDMPAWCRLTGHTLVRARHPEYVIKRRES